MQPIITANIYEERGTPFLCCYLYGEDGYVKGNLVKPYVAAEAGVELRRLVWAHYDSLPSFDVHTSTDAVYLACLREEDIAAQYKADTTETQRLFEEVRGSLADIYDLPPIEQPKELSVWKQRVVSFLQKLIRRLEGENTL
jgi:hypothetical protein